MKTQRSKAADMMSVITDDSESLHGCSPRRHRSKHFCNVSWWIRFAYCEWSLKWNVIFAELVYSRSACSSSRQLQSDSPLFSVSKLPHEHTTWRSGRWETDIDPSTCNFFSLRTLHLSTWLPYVEINEKIDWAGCTWQKATKTPFPIDHSKK